MHELVLECRPRELEIASMTNEEDRQLPMRNASGPEDRAPVVAPIKDSSSDASIRHLCHETLVARLPETCVEWIAPREVHAYFGQNALRNLFEQHLCSGSESQLVCT